MNPDRPSALRRARSTAARSCSTPISPHLPGTTFAPPGWDDTQVSTDHRRHGAQVWLDGDEADYRRLQRPVRGHLSEIAAVQRLIEGRADLFMQIRSADDIEAAKETRKLGIIFSFESAAALEDKLDRINLFRALGVRVMQLTYNMPSPSGRACSRPPMPVLPNLAARRLRA